MGRQIKDDFPEGELDTFADTALKLAAAECSDRDALPSTSLERLGECFSAAVLHARQSHEPFPPLLPGMGLKHLLHLDIRTSFNEF